MVIFGVTMIRSAVAGNIELTTETNLVNRQLTFAAIGFFVVILTAAIDYHLWASISRTMYLGMAILLAVLTIVGAAVFGILALLLLGVLVFLGRGWLSRER